MKLIFPLWVISFLLVFSVEWLYLTSFSKTENLAIVNVQLRWKVDALTVPEASVYDQYCSAGTVSAAHCSLSHGGRPTVACVLNKQELRRGSGEVTFGSKGLVSWPVCSSAVAESVQS